MTISRCELRVKGTVQGVGFRPFVYRLATSLGLAGSVRNTSAGVIIELVGPSEALAEFQRRLLADAPPLARIASVERTDLPPAEVTGFEIVESAGGARPTALIPPDVALCADCAREIADPNDRRFGYPFTNCTNCGPRFTLVTGLPYDRPQTTMGVFKMCDDCAAEYRDPADRRFHAEPVACPRCGPEVSLAAGTGTPSPSPSPSLRSASGSASGRASPQLPITQVAAWLAEGKVVAIKGLGGYHLACDARSVEAVETLRARKGRGQKPFAIMVRDLEEARRVAEVSDRAAALLTSPESPVVILPARADSGLAAGIAPRQTTVGVMLPYTPLHRLLFDASPPALVMTSGNLAEEPIEHRNEEAARKLGPLADYVLSHNREIAVPCDDSVVRMAGDLVIPVRRARGYVPRSVAVDIVAPPVLAVGGHHKNTFCLLREGEAILSQHLGDLDSLEVMEYFGRAVEHFRRLFQTTPEIVAHDLHPGYLSTRYAQSLEGVRLVPVQHHHAHVVSVMAEAGLAGPVIGVSYDGTGYGEDGTVWGGEILIADRKSFTRVGHLRAVPLPGGEGAIKHPERMALSHLIDAFGPEEAEGIAQELMPGFAEAELRVVSQQIQRGINSPLTSSMGRLFDAVGALLGATLDVTYEGQPAMELEAMAEGGPSTRRHKGTKGMVRNGLEEGGQAACRYEFRGGEMDLRAVIRAIVADLQAGRARAEIAAAFHNTVAAATVEMCARLRDGGGPADVVLSGGVMQNARLVNRLVTSLQAAGLRPHLHREVPPNDGGLSLGQAVVAAARSSE